MCACCRVHFKVPSLNARWGSCRKWNGKPRKCLTHRIHQTQNSVYIHFVWYTRTYVPRTVHVYFQLIKLPNAFSNFVSAIWKLGALGREMMRITAESPVLDFCVVHALMANGFLKCNQITIVQVNV